MENNSVYHVSSSLANSLENMTKIVAENVQLCCLTTATSSCHAPNDDPLSSCLHLIDNENDACEELYRKITNDQAYTRYAKKS